MFKCYSVVNKTNMFFSFIYYLVFFQNNFKRILIDFLFKATSQFTMQLHCESENSLTFFWINQSCIYYLEIQYFQLAKKFSNSP